MSQIDEVLLISEPALKYFGYAHLPDNLKLVSKPFYDLALDMVQKLPKNAERTQAIRKLLEAKDCAVRAML